MENLNCFTPRNTYKPTVGDIIFGEPEFNIGRKNKDVIEVGVTKEQCIKVERIKETIVSKNRLFENFRDRKTDNSSIDESRKDATWLIEHVEHRESLELLHSTLPESYLIKARRFNGKYDPDAEVIVFYTCGMYENTIPRSFEVIGYFDLGSTLL